ncbi:FHA domain-containing protein [Cyanobacteria bacterium FACHB-63]|nr:FHA domain-containing protein [Cyanobacteria bacterium FACHB-63]
MPFNPCRNSKCEYFNKSLPANAKVCPWCGEPLGSVFPPADPQPDPQPAPPAPPPPVYTPPQPPIQPPPPPVYTPPPVVQTWETTPPTRPTLRLIHSSGREFQLPGDSGSIGRTTASNPKTPEIDLAGIPNEGVVSRIHARIYWDAAKNTYMIIDNRSRNGTFLNQAILRPEVPYQLAQGMSLQLGQEGLVSFTIALI